MSVLAVNRAARAAVRSDPSSSAWSRYPNLIDSPGPAAFPAQSAGASVAPASPLQAPQSIRPPQPLGAAPHVWPLQGGVVEIPVQLPPAAEVHTTEQPPSGIEHVPPHRRSPPPPQNWSTGQVPQSSQPPHPSVEGPHPYPRLVHVAGTHGPASAGQRHLPSLLHVSEEGHRPQSSSPPHPSPAGPHSMASCRQLDGKHWPYVHPPPGPHLL
jgi:hypothetical protein